MTDCEVMKESRRIKAEYAREWRKRNPTKTAEYCKRYWEKKAKQALEQKDGETVDG